MDHQTTVLLVLVALLSANQVVCRIPVLRDRFWPFWTMQLVDLVVGTGVLVFGVPGFDHAPPVRYVVGLMFFLHIATNLKLRTAAERRRLLDARDHRRENLSENESIPPLETHQG